MRPNSQRLLPQMRQVARSSIKADVHGLSGTFEQPRLIDQRPTT